MNRQKYIQQEGKKITPRKENVPKIKKKIKEKNSTRAQEQKSSPATAQKKLNTNCTTCQKSSDEHCQTVVLQEQQKQQQLESLSGRAATAIERERERGGERQGEEYEG